MIVVRTFSDILTDNDENYLNLLESVISSIDNFSHMEISKFNNEYKFRLATTLPVYNNLILQEILDFHNRLGIHLELSKSIKTSGIIDFSIKLF